MKIHTSFKFILLSLVFLLIACSSGDSSSSCGSTNCNDLVTSTNNLSGNVIDPEIVDATVQIISTIDNLTAYVCDDSGIGICEEISDSNGFFNFKFNKNLDLSKYEIITNGGYDKRTGMHFDGVSLKAPLQMYTQGNDFNVTPITSLVATAIRNGYSYETALNTIQNFLQFDSPDLLLLNPIENELLLKKSIILSIIINELKENHTDSLFTIIYETTSLFNTDGSINSFALEELIVNPAVVKEIISAEEILNSNVPVDDMFASIKKNLLKSLLAKYIYNSFENVDINNAQYLTNLNSLTDALFEAISEYIIPLDGLGAQRMVRYVFFYNNIESFSDISSKNYSSQFSLLSSDPTIAEFLKTLSNIDVKVPLLFSDMLHQTNIAMLEYYYNSNLSNLYKAEKVITYVRDNNVNDEVMLSVAIGKANAGFYNEAISLIDNSIYQSVYKADAFRLLANIFIKLERNADATFYLNKAFNLYKLIIESKGFANITSNDISDLIDITVSYVKAQNISMADEVIGYFEGLKIYADDVTSYGYLFIGLKNIVDTFIGYPNINNNYIVDEDLINLELGNYFIIKMYEIANDYVPNESRGIYDYKAKIFALAETSLRYAHLSDIQKVVEIYNIVKLIRENDGFPENQTAKNTRYYMQYFVSSFINVGLREDANTIIDELVSYFKDIAMYSIITDEILNGDMELAFSMVEDFLYDQDKVTSMTFEGYKHFASYLLIDHNLFDKAVLVIDKVVEIIDNSRVYGIDRFDYINLIEHGFFKTAHLFSVAGDIDKATISLVKAKAVTDNFSDLEYISLAYRGIAIGYTPGNYNGYYQNNNIISALQILSDLEDIINNRGLDVLDFVTHTSDLIQAYIIMEDYSNSLRLLNIITDSVNLISSDSSEYSEIEDEIKSLILTSKLYVDSDAAIHALPLLKNAYSLIKLLPENMQTVNFFNNGKGLIDGFVYSGNYADAIIVANSLGFTDSRNDALLYIADKFSFKDAFHNTWVASVDTDKDGRPDFFHPLATSTDIAASGLILDDDCDGDGILNSEDALPLWVN